MGVLLSTLILSAQTPKYIEWSFNSKRTAKYIEQGEYPAFIGQGNWGDLRNGAASQRYTETKLSNIGMKMLECNSAGEYVPNYTGEFKEPVVIPTRFPYFFVNPCSGIAVGIKCEIPGHNLEEVVNALKVVVRKGDETKIKDIHIHILMNLDLFHTMF